MLTPLSESLEKLRRAQRALVRRKRRSRVRVSFQHSTSIRGPKTEAARTPSGNVGKEGVQRLPLVVPGPSLEFDINNSAWFERNASQRPVIPRRESSSVQDHGCCPASPPRTGVPLKAIFEKGTGNSSRQLPENRPYFGTLAKSPVQVPPKPEAQRAALTATSEYSNSGDLDGGSDYHAATQAARATADKKSTSRLPTPAVPRYTVFPKSQNRPRCPPVGGTSTVGDVIRSDPPRRSLSQQCRLSSLVPPGCLPTYTKRTRPDKNTHISATESRHGTSSAQETRPPSPMMTVDEFARELQQYAEATAAAGKLPAPASEAAEPHNSVQTVEEILPYRSQFREAGLAVTSDDQKPPIKEKSHLRFQQSSEDDRLRFDGSRSRDQGSSSTNKIPANGTVVNHVPPDAAPSGGKLGRFKLSVQSSPLCPNQVTEAGSETKASNARPSAIFVGEKPLPAEPAPPKPTFLSRDRAAPGDTLHEARTSAVGRPLGKLDNTESETSTTAVLYPSTSSSTSQDSSSKFDKCLPGLSSPSIPSQTQQALSFPNKTAGSPPVRLLPMTIEEEWVLLSGKRHTPINQTSIVCYEDEVVVEAHNTQTGKTQTTTVLTRPTASCKPELPETWLEAIGSPSSFEKALDDVVRKLEDMGEGKSTKGNRPRSVGKKKPKSTSPSQRLQRATMICRQQLAEGSAQQSSPNGQQAPAIPPRKSRSITQRSMLPPSETVNEQVREDGDIKDKDVLRGLKVLCAASADRDLDAWIHAQTGLRLRRFLSDLKSFEGLAQEGIAVIDGERSKRGKADQGRARARVEKAAKRRSMKK